MSIPDLRSLRRAQATPRWLRWLRVLGLGLFLSYGLYVALGFWVVPSWLRRQVEERGTSSLGRTVKLEAVEFNPFRLSLELRGFAIQEVDGRDFFGWQRLAVDFSMSSLWRGEWVFSSLAVQDLHGQWVVGTDGRLNFADIQARLNPSTPNAAAQPPSRPRPVVVEALRLEVRRLVYADQSLESPFVTSLGPVSLSLKNFHTSSSSLSAGEFSAQTEAGEEFHWRGGVSLNPLASQGHIDLKAFSLPKHAPFYSRVVPFAITSGDVAASVDYEVSFPDGRLSYALQGGSATVTKLKLAPRGGGAPWVILDEIAATGLTGASNGPLFRLERLAVTGGSIEVLRDSLGLNFSRWAPTASAGPAPADPGSKPTVKVGEVALSGLSIQYTDTSLAQPVKVRFPALQTTLRDLDSSNLAADLPLTFRTSIGANGSIDATGTLSLAPVTAKVAVQVTNLELAPWSGYLEQVLPYAIEQGSLQAQMDVAVALPTDAPPLVGAKASVSIDQFSLARSASGTPLARWDTLAVTGIEATTQPTLRLVVGAVEVSQPVVAVRLGADGQLNWTPSESGAPAENTGTAPAPAAASVAVDEVLIKGGRVEYQDDAIAPQVRLALSNLEGKVSGLSSASLARADVDVSGKFDGGAPFSVKGQVNPLSDEVFSDVAVSLRGLDLLPASPYAGRYVGRELARGNASLEFRVKVSRQVLAVTPALTLDQLTLGRTVASPQATSLPVSLAIALLKDANGRIQLQVPIEGRLDDPQFRVLPLVWGVVGNLLEKAAKAPFALLGSMFGGGGDELGFVEFAPGEIGLSERGIQKMDTVAKALRERPALSLDMVGGYTEDTDRALLRERALEAELRQALWEELRRSQPAETVPAPALLVLTPEAEARLVALRYQARLGESASSGSAGLVPDASTGAPSVAPSSPPPAERPGLIRRVVRFLAGASSAPASTTSGLPPPRAVSGPPASVDSPATPASSAVSVDPTEMRRRLLESMVIDPSALQFLADDRAQAVRAHLIEAGQISPERLFLVPGRSGSTRVELTLK